MSSQDDIFDEAVMTQRSYAHPEELLGDDSGFSRPDATFLPSLVSGALYSEQFALSAFRVSLEGILDESPDA